MGCAVSHPLILFCGLMGLLSTTLSFSESHFHASKRAFSSASCCSVAAPQENAGTTTAAQPPPAYGNDTATTAAQPPSIYDSIIPACICWNPARRKNQEVFPLVAYLEANFHRGTAWHRNDERLARGLQRIPSNSTQLEDWERGLVWSEILLLKGNPSAVFRHLARAWGRDRAFQNRLGLEICRRRGNVERKRKRSDGATAFESSPSVAKIGTAMPGTESPLGEETAVSLPSSPSVVGLEDDETLAAFLLDCMDHDSIDF